MLILLMVWSCSQQGPAREWKSLEKTLQTHLITVADGDTIDLPEGNFMFTRSLTMDGKSNVLIRGKGINRTTLSWKNQVEGAQGFWA